MAEPLRLHPDNPHYFLFRGQPTVLVTSADHYGSIVNRPYDFRKSLDTLAAAGLNHARVFVGPYREPEGAFNIKGNVLAPAEKDYAAPWMRGASGKFDLTRFNPEYFDRITGYVRHAATRGIVVEVTLFTTYYNDQSWRLSPLHPDNSVQGYGKGLRSDEVLAMKDPALQDVLRAFTAEVVRQLRGDDNLYFELCNEPYIHGVTPAWQRDIASVITETESDGRPRHLISQNIANHQGRVTDPVPGVSIFNFHYARPPVAVEQNWHWNKPIGLNETGFDGWQDAIYRFQAWDFLAAGGALYNNLDYSFTVGHEDGTFSYPPTQPGGGTTALRSQLGYLKKVFDGLDFLRLEADSSVVAAGVPENASARARSRPGSQYFIYIHHGRILQHASPRYVVETRRHLLPLQLILPAGNYKIEWHDPRHARLHRTDTLQHPGGRTALLTPEYQEDLAVVIRSTRAVAKTP